MYDLSKGLEPIILNIANPSEISQALYRARELERDLNRSLVGIVVNNIDTMTDLCSSSSARKSFDAYSTSFLEDSYKHVFKQPYRMLDAFFHHIASGSNASGSNAISGSGLPAGGVPSSSESDMSTTDRGKGRFIVVVPQSRLNK